VKSQKDLFVYLQKLGIETKTYEHEPVYTVAQAYEICADIPGGHCKNLFLKDKNKQFWLVVALNTTRINLKKLAQKFSAPALRFASKDELLHYLGVPAGSVTPFALLNDRDHEVRVILDSNLFDHKQTMFGLRILNFHPLINTATTALSCDDFKIFIDSLEHRVETFDFS